MMNNDFRKYLPNLITFLALGSGLASIALSSQGFVFQAGLLILTAALLDLADGFLARKMQVASHFGRELDSLSDMVNFGVAPASLICHHLLSRGDLTWWFYGLLLLLPLTGAFRLARFNLQPMKSSSSGESIGLTISTSGIISSLAVLSDLSTQEYSYSLGVYTVLIILLSSLMVSKLTIPTLAWFNPMKGFFLIYLLTAGVLLLFFPVFVIGLIYSLGILLAAIVRNLYLKITLHHPVG